MLFFFAMESNAFTRILPEIGRVAEVAGKRRGEHAAALWVVSEYLSDFKAGLVEFLWDQSLSNGAKLGLGRLDELRRSPLCEEIFTDQDASDHRWGLFVLENGELTDAHKVPPDVLVEIVRVLPAFLESYSAALRSGVGTSESLESARAMTDSVFSPPES